MRNGLILTAILGICLVAVTSIEFGPESSLSPSDPGPAGEESTRGAPLEPIEIPVDPAPVPTQTPGSTGSLRLPDGSYLPTLNGVQEDLELTWPGHLPFSPVVSRVIDSQGIERYLHADGSQSTTQMVYRSDLGREDAAVLVSTPRPVAPIKKGAGRRR